MAVKTRAAHFSELYPSYLKQVIEPSLKEKLAMKKAKPAAPTSEKKPPLAPAGGKKGGKAKAG